MGNVIEVGFKCFIQKLSFPNQNQPIFELKLIRSCSEKPEIFVSIFVQYLFQYLLQQSCSFGHSKTTPGCSHSLPSGFVWKMYKLGKFLFLCLKIRKDSVCAHLQSSLLSEIHIL